MLQYRRFHANPVFQVALLFLFFQEFLSFLNCLWNLKSLIPPILPTPKAINVVGTVNIKNYPF